MNCCFCSEPNVGVCGGNGTAAAVVGRDAAFGPAAACKDELVAAAAAAAVSGGGGMAYTFGDAMYA